MAKGRDQFRLAVLASLDMRGPLTADELAEGIGKSILYTRPLVCEMAKWSPPLVEDAGSEARNAISGKSAMRVRATMIGLQYLRAKKIGGQKPYKGDAA